MIDTLSWCLQRMITFCLNVISICHIWSFVLQSYVLPSFSSSDSAFGMEMFKRMLQTGHPTMLSWLASSEALWLLYFISSSPLCTCNAYAACEYFMLNYVNWALIYSQLYEFMYLEWICCEYIVWSSNLLPHRIWCSMEARRFCTYQLWNSFNYSLYECLFWPWEFSLLV